MKVNNLSNLIFGLIFLLFSTIFFFLSLNINSTPNEAVDARTMPLVYSVLIFIFGVVLSLSSFKRDNEKENTNYRGPLLTISIMVLYAILVPVIGFYISTILFMFTFFTVVKFKNKILFIITPLVICLFIYIVFEILLNVNVPVGTLFN